MSEEILVDPTWFRAGAFGDLGASEDTYFEGDDFDTAFGAVLDEQVDQLPEPDRTVLMLQVFERRSYREIAEDLGWTCGRPPRPNKKRAWRVQRRATDRMRERLRARSAWLDALTSYDLDAYLED